MIWLRNIWEKVSELFKLYTKLLHLYNYSYSYICLCTYSLIHYSDYFTLNVNKLIKSYRNVFYFIQKQF